MMAEIVPRLATKTHPRRSRMNSKALSGLGQGLLPKGFKIDCRGSYESFSCLMVLAIKKGGLMTHNASINAVWQQNERTASDERERSLCPPHEDGDEQEEDDRDYAKEAFRIMAGKTDYSLVTRSRLHAEKEHLLALRDYYREIIEEIKEMVGKAIEEVKR